MDYGRTNPESVKNRQNSGDFAWGDLARDAHDTPSTPMNSSNPTPENRSGRALGHRAIFSSEAMSPLDGSDSMGIIRDAEPLALSTEQPAPNINENLISPHGDHISGTTASAIDDLITEFKEPYKPLSSTYSELQQMRDIYQSKMREGSR